MIRWDHYVLVFGEVRDSNGRELKVEQTLHCMSRKLKKEKGEESRNLM